MKRNFEQWQRVNSSCVHRLRYHKNRRALDLEFSGGARYEYFDVSPAEFDKIKRAGSIGQFVNRQIKKHRFRKLNAEN
ncbi:MAG: KTSC domain-containing protein [Limisphaerales bacterium]